jgi:hypothetical protein
MTTPVPRTCQHDWARIVAVLGSGAEECRKCGASHTLEDLRMDLARALSERDEARASQVDEDDQRYLESVCDARDAALVKAGNLELEVVSLRFKLDTASRERDEARAEIARLRNNFAPRCLQCGARTEPERWCYAIPTCFACLPPPPPIPVLEVSGSWRPTRVRVSRGGPRP